MATYELKGFNDMVDKLDIKQYTSETKRRALKKSADEIIKYQRQEVPIRTGGLCESIKASFIDDNNIEIYPRGANEYGERYAKIGAILEYGKAGTAPNPWITRANLKAEEPAFNVLIGELNRENT